MLGRDVGRKLKSSPPAEVWSPELRSMAQSCDALICNLECCISSRGRPTDRIAGKPFFFRAPPVAVGSLSAIGVRVAGLANNHALDFEEKALADTLDHLNGSGIAAVGAGRDPREARMSAVIEAGGLRLGIVAASDHPAEFAADDGNWGIAYADLPRGAPDWLLAEVAGLRDSCDTTIVLLHWGPNMATGPDAWQLRLGQELLDAGAGAVAGHSAHVFHGVGLSSGRPLLYDLGGALDDYAIDGRLRNDLGLMAIWTPDTAELDLVGLHLAHCRTELARGEEAEWIGGRLQRACAELGTGVARIEEGRFRVQESTK